jgi:tRNA1Val (adenine37-N6)-methyltransferase
MVLIEAVKGGNPRLKVEPPLIMYESEGKYSREILEIYGHPVGPKNDRQSV